MAEFIFKCIVSELWAKDETKIRVINFSVIILDLMLLKKHLGILFISTKNDINSGKAFKDRLCYQIKFLL